ncbi:discoidin domain-containing protein [Paenibacillus methanolicus]|uniref:Pectate lyase-like protein n=1 Tax=Paenibacillus methanolicus TaxID=582686 RepID=A0A5S5CI31_9BACL|nr:discoidin domain-containing protein [Paenibacillus methanolicus]TYP78162.1 pectate lyase-like protein [Paenibacillus methanolicus]
MKGKALPLLAAICLGFGAMLPAAGDQAAHAAEEASVTAAGELPLGADGRSRLYPSDWYPGWEDGEGRFVHDFSYAGYHRGEKPLPTVDSAAGVDVTKAPYNADPSGQTDATDAIQRAIDETAAHGGGVVYLPAGTYRLSPPEGRAYALGIRSSGIVLKGAGEGKTFLYNAATYMKQKDIIRVGGGDWVKTPVSTKLRRSALEPSSLLPVEDATGFAIGDYVMVTFETTEEFLAELGMHNKWASRLGKVEPIFYRRIVAVDPVHRTVTVDIPTRYPLKTRDNVLITKTQPPVSEVGLEDFSIANAQNPKSGLGEDDFKVEGTAGYETDNAKAINVIGAADSWIRDVSTYKPAGNETYHILSKGIILDRAKNVTVDNVSMAYPQYRGANGNGYLYQLIGNDNLIARSKAVGARHSFTFANFSANGNVMHDVYAENSSLLTDFHMYLSMANLIDNMTLSGDAISAITRDYGSSPTNRHGVVTTQSVFWNTNGLVAHKSKPGVIVESEQFGNGYVIGTRGPVSGVNTQIAGSIPEADTKPFDMAEGVGEGDRLSPASLFADQFARRTQELGLGLSALLVDGEPVDGMQFLKTSYAVTLPFGTKTAPVISAAPLAAGASVEIEQPEGPNGTGAIRITHGGTSKTYAVSFEVAANPVLPKSIAVWPDRSERGWRAAGDAISAGNEGKLQTRITLHNGEIVDPAQSGVRVKYEVVDKRLGSIARGDVFKAKRTGTATITATAKLNGVTISGTLTVQVVEPMPEPEGKLAAIRGATASADDGNVPANAIDRDPASRWSAEGDGQYLVLELEKARPIDGVSILFYNGHQRSSAFDVEVSEDGVHYVKALAGAASGKPNPNAAERFDFAAPLKAKYIKFVGYGNELNGWNSIVEIWAHEAK